MARRVYLALFCYFCVRLDIARWCCEGARLHTCVCCGLACHGNKCFCMLLLGMYIIHGALLHNAYWLLGQHSSP